MVVRDPCSCLGWQQVKESGVLLKEDCCGDEDEKGREEKSRTSYIHPRGEA